VLAHPVVRVAKPGELRQVRDDQHLVPVREPPQLLADHRADAPADALVDLVEDQGGHLVGVSQHALERQHDPRRLTTGGDFRDRAQRLAHVGRHVKLHLVDSIRAERQPPVFDEAAFGIVLPRDLHLEPGALHFELVQLADDGLGQFLGGGPPLGAQLGGQGPDLVQQPVFLGAQLGQPLLAVRDRLELGAGFVGVRQRRLDAAAVLALEPRDDLDPLLDLVQPVRIVFDVLAVLADGARQLVGLGAQAFGQLGVFGDRRVELRQPRQIDRRLGQQIHAGCLAHVAQQRVLGLGRELGDLLGVDQPVALLLELDFLVGAQGRAVDLLHLVLQHIYAAGQGGLVGEQALDLGPDLLQRPDHFLEAGPRVFQPGIAIEQVDVLGRAQQREVLALAVNVDQHPANLAVDGQVAGRAVDARQAAPAAAHFAGEDHLVR